MGIARKFDPYYLCTLNQKKGVIKTVPITSLMDDRVRYVLSREGIVWILFVVQPINSISYIMKQRLLRNNWTLLGFLLITMLASLSYAHASVRGAGTQATTGCLVTFSETNEWGTIKAYYFDVENGRGKVFFKSGARLPKGTAVNFEATVSKGWEVGSWTVNDKVTKGRSRTRLNFYLEKDSKIALTCKRLKQYKISYASDPADGGTIKVYWKKQVGYYGDEVEEVSIPDGGTVLDKTKVYIEARPKAGYRFDRYVINEKSQTGDSSDKNTYVLTPTEDLTIRGIFISTRPVTYAIHFAQPAHGHLKLFAGEQEIQPNATLERGTKVKVEATPDEGYELKSLKVNKQDILSAKKFTVERESTVVATFEQKKPVTYAIHFAQPAHGHLKLFAGEQEIQPNAMLERGTEVKVEATPDEGYELKSLKINEQDILSAKKFTVAGESTVVATFEQKTGVEEPDESLLLKVYPNPTDSYCIVSVPATYIGETAYLLGAGGELLRLLPLVQSEVTLDLAYLPIGTYLLKVGATDHSLTIIRK